MFVCLLLCLFGCRCAASGWRNLSSALRDVTQLAAEVRTALPQAIFEPSLAYPCRCLRPTAHACVSACQSIRPLRRSGRLPTSSPDPSNPSIRPSIRPSVHELSRRAVFVCVVVGQILGLIGKSLEVLRRRCAAALPLPPPEKVAPRALRPLIFAGGGAFACRFFLTVQLRPFRCPYLRWLDHPRPGLN